MASAGASRRERGANTPPSSTASGRRSITAMRRHRRRRRRPDGDRERRLRADQRHQRPRRRPQRRRPAPGTYAAVADPATGVAKPTEPIKVGADLPARPRDADRCAHEATRTRASNDRPPLAQTFSLNAQRRGLTVVVNHFKSKGCCPTPPARTPTRATARAAGTPRASRQAEALLGFIDDRPGRAGDDGRAGDRRPERLRRGGSDPGAARRRPGQPRSSGRPRATTPTRTSSTARPATSTTRWPPRSLVAQVTGVTEWHINADEPSVIDYNTEFKPQDLYQPHAVPRVGP